MIPKRVLVVDDEQNSREGLSKILTKEGYVVHTAENGKKALTEAENNKFDLIITDLRMPEMDGIEVLEKLRKKNKDMGVVIVTAYGEVNSYLKAMNLGAFEYLNKPIHLEELRRVINKALHESSKVS
jgi:two-component system response regulator (stage 0 sporulation protein F)